MPENPRTDMPAPVSLLPRAGTVTLADGVFVMDAATTVAAPPALRAAVALLRRTVGAATGLPLAASGAASPAASITFLRQRGLAEEGYTLVVAPEGIRITAGGVRGALWAVQSLRELLPARALRSAGAGDATRRWEIPAVHVRDEPAFAWRGLMLDVARHFFPVHEVRRLLDQMALHKLNVLHLHLTDDQGWRIHINRHPRLTEVGGWRPSSQVGPRPGAPQDGRPHGGFYTHDDIREIVAYAAGLGITVVPEIEMPGHVQAALAAYPQLGIAAVDDAPLTSPWTKWGVNTAVLNVEEATVAFFCEVLDEVVDLFPSQFIGIGGDECTKDRWRADPRTAARMRELGIPSADQLQGWFLSRIDAHLAARGRRAFGWDEIVSGPLTAGATVAGWRGTGGLLRAARTGHDAVACTEDRVYFDYRQSASPDEPIPVSTVTDLARVYGFDPVPAELEPAHRTHILGGEAAVWTEHIDSARRLDYMAFPRLCALAEVLWSGPAAATGGSFDEFTSRLNAHLPRLAALGIEYRPLDGPRPWQHIPGVAGRTRTRAERAAQVAAMVEAIG